MKINYVIKLLILIGFTFSCKTPYQVYNVKKNNISISDSISINPEIEAFIKPYKSKLDAKMNQVLAYNPIQLDKEGADYPLGIFVTDLIFNETNKIFQKSHPDKKIDAVLMNTGGLRRNFSPGNLTVRSIYELMPFENELVVVTITADKFLEMVNFLKESENNHPISGFSFYKDREEPNILIGGKPLNPKKLYNIVTNDYLLKGGDNMNFFLNPVNAEFLNIKIRDLFIESLQKVDTIKLDRTPRYILN